jgi:hypothetical protein
VFVGPEGIPFGIHKEFLCAKSTFYRKYFDDKAKAKAKDDKAKDDEANEIEHIVNLPDTPVEVFAYAQNFLYTGRVFPSLDNLPSYEVLIGVWKLGHELEIDGLCDATLEAMAECRRVTQHIPASPLLVQVWKDTPEGSSIRKLLLSWAAEYMRSSESRAEFARSLPQEVLSELVVAMSSSECSPVATDASSSDSMSAAQRPSVTNAELGEADGRPAKRRRASDGVVNGASSAASPGRKPGPRASLSAYKPAPKGPKRRASAVNAGSQQFSSSQKLNFCADLLGRMLSGPGKPFFVLPLCATYANANAR